MIQKFKRSLLFGVAGISLLAFSACSSLDYSEKCEGLKIAPDSGKPVAHIHAKVSGLYLFYFIPILTGNPETVGTSAWFKDTVVPDSSVSMLTKKATDLGAERVSNITIRETENGAWSLFILWTKNTQASGNAVR